MITTESLKKLTDEQITEMSLGERLKYVKSISYGFQSRTARLFLRSPTFVGLVAKGNRNCDDMLEYLKEKTILILQTYIKNPNIDKQDLISLENLNLSVTDMVSN